jgi:hypothetical protein
MRFLADVAGAAGAASVAVTSVAGARTPFQAAARQRVLHALDRHDSWAAFCHTYMQLRDELTPEDRQAVRGEIARRLCGAATLRGNPSHGMV